MADDIDIEEHDVLDHPAIKNMFPDLSIVKHEIMHFDGDSAEITEVSQDSHQPEVTQPDSTTEDLETLLAVPIKIEDSDSYTREEDRPGVTEASEHPSSFDNVQVSVDELRQPSKFDNVQVSVDELRQPSKFDNVQVSVDELRQPSTFYGNKIILGTKPKRNTEKISYATSSFESINEDKCGIIKDNCDLEADEIRKCLAAKLVLNNWGEYLENSKSFCSDCDILFATVNSFDAHKMQAHSFLVALQEMSVTPVSEANATDVSTKNITFQKTQCQVCSKVFANRANLHRHCVNVHNCKPPRIVKNEPQTQTALPSRQVAKKRTAPKVPKITIKIKPPETVKKTISYTIKKPTLVAKPAMPKVVAPKSPAIPRATNNVAAPKVTKQKPKSDLVCGHCNVEYLSKEDLINHLYDLLTPKTLPSNECNQCNAKFNTKPGLAKHKLSHLAKNKSVAKTPIGKQVGEKPQIVGTKQYHRCQICTSYINLKQSRVKKHMERYHKTIKTVKYICSGFIPKCQLCGLNLANPEGYNKHIKVIHRRDNYKRTIPVAVKPQMIGSSKPKATLPTAGTSKPKASFAASKIKTKQFAPNKLQPKSIRFGTKTLQEMKNPPIPQSSLFKCPRCRTHFATHLSAYFHMWQCHGGYFSVFKCNKCNVIMKKHNKALHEKQHLFTDEFEIVTISKDKKVSFKYLSNCPKCGIHFKEMKFWKHYTDCGKSSIDSFYCTDCDLLIDAALKHSHRALHKTPGEFKIFEYAAIDDATNERFEANSAAVNTDTTSKSEASQPMVGASKLKATLPTVRTSKPKASFAASKIKTKQFAPNKLQPKSIRFGTKTLQEMKNPPIPQSSLFKCPRCRTHFATHLSGYCHMWQCHGRRLSVFKCNKCNVIMKKHNKALHEKQHLFTDDFEIVTISKDKRASFKYLSNCPKCGIHFKEIKFWLHYADCGKLSIDSFYCTDCDLLIDATLKQSHRALHKKPGEFKIFEYAAIDDAANERFEANSAAVNTDTTRETVKNAAQAAPKIFGPKLKGKAEAPKGRESKFEGNKLKVGRIPPAKTNATKTKASLKRKRIDVSDESFTTRKKAKIISKRKGFQSRNSQDNFKLRYCDTCHRYVPFGRNVEYHQGKLCVDGARPMLCTLCGIALTRGPLLHHLKLHETHKTLTIHDFEFYKLSSYTRINPPLPRLIYCTNCKTYFKKRKPPGEKLLPHNCNEEQFTCETCDIKVNEFGYELHKSFHAYDMNRGKASEESSENLSEHTKNLASSKRQQTVLKTLYQCTTCDVMMTERHVEEHKNFKYDCHNLKKVYQRCGYCNFSILSRDLRDHARKHETDPSLCKDNFNIILFDKAVRNKPAADDDKNEGEYKKFKVYKCEECELCVEPRKQVRFHQCDKDAKTYYCPVCEVQVHHLAHIHKHGMYSDFVPENIDFINFSTDQGEVKIDDAWDSNSEDDAKYKLYKCRNCEMCLELPQINIHKCYPHSKKYVCPICKYVFLHYRAHLRNHELKPDFVRSNIKIVEFGKKLENSCANEKTTKDADSKTETTAEDVTDSDVLQKLLIESSEEIDDFTLYACKKCNINFYKPSVVKNHVCAKQTTPYRCLPCRLTFDNIGYKTHILLHSKHDYKRSSFNIEAFEVDPKSTTYCVAQNGSNVTGKQEVLASTSMPDTKVDNGAAILYKCLCGLHFLCRETLDEHQAVCSPIHRASGQCCTKCNLHFTPQTLYKHLIQHHDIKAGEFRYRIREADLGASVDLKTLYKCATCETHFVNKLILKDHYRAQTCKPEALNQECPNCGLEFHYTNLVKHNQLHHGLSDFQETDFDVVVMDKTDFPDLEDKTSTKFKLGSEKQVTEEDYSTKEDAVKTLFKCRKCDLHFMLESALRGHLSRNCESKQETCSTCGLSFAVNTLRRHTQLHHDQLNLTSGDFHVKYQDGTQEKKPPKKHIDVTSQSENVLHKCIKCNLYFMSEQSYRQHIRSINTHWSCKPRRTCEICNIVMPTATYYRHKQRHRFKQNLTLKDFTIVEYTNEDELNDRMEYERLMSDEYYTKVLKTRYNQELHKCDKCDLHFMTAGALAVHVLKFDHKTPKERSVLSCDDCGLNFLEQSLVRHKYIHHEKMRFARDELEIKSEVTPKNNRQKAKMLPQKLYKCRECDNHFMNPNTCYRHVSSTHTNLEGMIHCDVCKLKFLRPSLKRHMKVHHDKGHNLKDIMVEDYEPVYADGMDIISNLPKIDIYMAADAPVNPKPNKKERTEEFADKKDIPQNTTKTRNSKTSVSARLHYKSIDEFDVQNKNVLFKCQKCNLYFMRRGSLNSHLSVNHKAFKNPGRCEKCNIVMSLCTLSRHNRIHHAPENDLSFDDFVVIELASIEDNTLHKCNKCDIYFLTYRSLERHVSDDHLKFKEPVTCDKCNITMSKLTLHRHNVLHHSPGNDLRLKDLIIKEYCKQDESNIEIPVESARVLKRYNEELHKCEGCDIHFLTAGALSVHAGSLDHKTPSHRSILTCDDCGLTFLEQSLLRHKFIHHKTMGLDNTSLIIKTDVTSRKKKRKLEAMLPQKMYKCKDCNNHFMNPNTCYRHVSTAHKPLKRMIPCDTCGLRFLKPSLERHNKVHHEKGHMLEDIMVEEYEPVDADKNNETCALPKIRIYMAGDILEKSESNTSSSQIHKNKNEVGDAEDNALHKCRDCNLYFLTYRAVKHHLSMYHLKMKTVKCATCNIVMSVTAHYRHLRHHHIEKNLKLEDFVIKEYPEISEEVDNALSFEIKSARVDKEIDDGTDVDNDFRENKEMDLEISNSIETEEVKSPEEINILENKSNTACERDDKGVVNTKRNFKFDHAFTFENSGIPCTRLNEDINIDRNTDEVLTNAHVDQKKDNEDSKVNLIPNMTEVSSSIPESKIPALMLPNQNIEESEPANEETNTSKPRKFKFDKYFAFEDNPQKRKYKSLESMEPINRNKRICKSLDTETTVNAFNNNNEVVNIIVADKSYMKSITLSQIVRNVINHEFLATYSSAMQTDDVVDDVKENDVIIIESDDTSDKDIPLAKNDQLEIPVESSLSSNDDAPSKVRNCKVEVLENLADELNNFQGSRQDDQSKKNIEHDNIVQNRVNVDSGLEVDGPVDEAHLDNRLENLDKSESEVGIYMSCEDEDLKLVYNDDDETGEPVDETNVSESPV